jgi:hypothetical protein
MLNRAKWVAGRCPPRQVLHEEVESQHINSDLHRVMDSGDTRTSHLILDSVTFAGMTNHVCFGPM